MIEKNDKELLGLFFAGDEEAFSVLVKKYIRPVYNFLSRFSGDSALLDDLTQETFLKAWKNISRFEKDRSFKTWLFVIAKNTAFDFFKKKRAVSFSFLENEDGYGQLDKIPEENLLPQKFLEKKDSERELQEKLAKIPEKYRLLLLMRYKDDFSLLEISEILGISYNTIKSQHNRALGALKKEFQKNP